MLNKTDKKHATHNGLHCFAVRPASYRVWHFCCTQIAVYCVTVTSMQKKKPVRQKIVRATETLLYIVLSLVSLHSIHPHPRSIYLCGRRATVTYNWSYDCDSVKVNIPWSDTEPVTRGKVNLYCRYQQQYTQSGTVTVWTTDHFIYSNYATLWLHYIDTSFPTNSWH